MSLLSGRKAYQPLELGKSYKAVMVGYEEYEPNADADTKSQGFIVFKFELEDGRTISDTRSFPVGTDILSKQLLLQADFPNGIEQEILFQMCIDQEIPFDMWVSMNGDYTNYTFQEPKEPSAVGVSKPVSTVASADTFN